MKVQFIFLITVMITVQLVVSVLSPSSLRKDLLSHVLIMVLTLVILLLFHVDYETIALLTLLLGLLSNIYAQNNWEDE